ncbi:MAG: polymer-forming cytoskeletal protein [Anaerolineae bacterium]|nr:polymer-forming cytoskeletal protein [Anaerolineae bacterium]
MRKVGFLFILIIVFASLAIPVLADDPEGDVVIWGDNYTLASGERIKGNLLVYGGNVDLQDESQVDGDVTVFGGNLSILGEVAGGVTVWGGNVDIGATATIRGQVVSIGGQVHREEGADVRGDEIEGFPFRPPVVPKPPIPPRISRVTVDRPWGSDVLHQVGNAFRSAFGILLMVVLGVLVVVFLPRHTETVAETMVKVPVESFVSGIVAMVVGAVALVVLSIVSGLLVITICLAPVGLLLLLPFLVAGVALLLGWIAAGLLLGVKVLRALTHKEPNHVAAVAVGILFLSLLSFLPCVGWVIVLLVATWGLGAVVYSLFGTRAYDEPAPRIPVGKGKGYDPRMDKV